MKLHHSLLVTLCCALVGASHAGPRNTFAGRYEGKWGKPGGLLVRDADTGDVIEGGVIKTSITLKIPPGTGRRNGSVDVTPLVPTNPGDGPYIARLVTDFGEPDFRRGGKLAIYRARAEWKLAQVIPTNNLPGTLIVRLIKRGSRCVVKRGNLQLFLESGPPDYKLTGQIRARK